MNRTHFAFEILILSLLAWNQAFADVCNRSPLIKKEIEDAVGKSCDAITAEDLASIENIGIQYQNMGDLGEQDFSGLTGLTYLFLADNQITSVPAGIFDDLTNLKTLSLNGNKILSLPENLFKKLTKLSKLDLHQNQLSSLPQGIFKGLVRLDELRLSVNNLTTLPDDIFLDLKNIDFLGLNHNQLTSLPKGLFDGMRRLSMLSLDSNKLNLLPPGLFDDLESLSYFYFSENLLTVLPTGVFKGLTSIQSLNLANNQISLIENDVFSLQPGECKLSNDILSKIGMDGNPISVFPAYQFSNLRNPYQCELTPPGDADFTLDRFFHITLMQLDSGAPTFTQVERIVPLLEKAFARDYLQMPITGHYGFDLIPSLNGSVDGLHMVRQLAVDVCALVPSFCPVRQEIHQFPLLEHLTAVTQLKKQLTASNAPAATIAKVVDLEKTLSQMFSRDLNYQAIRDHIPEGSLKQSLDQFFAQTSWSFADISEASNKIQTELVQPHDDAWKEAYFIPLFKIKSFLVYSFKKNFWNQTVESLQTKDSLHALVTMSRSVALLTEREAVFLNSSIDRGDEFKAIIEKAVQWQVKNLEREHFSQVSNPRYNPVDPQYTDPKGILEPAFEKIVRTSLIAEWDRLR